MFFIRKNQQKTLKIEEEKKKTSDKHRCETKALAVRVDEEVRIFSFS